MFNVTLNYIKLIFKRKKVASLVLLNKAMAFSIIKSRLNKQKSFNCTFKIKILAKDTY